MPKVPKKKAQKAKGAIPKYGRPEKHVQKDLGLQKFSSNVPLGNNDPTVVQGVMYGGMPNSSRRARGPLRQQQGKRG